MILSANASQVRDLANMTTKITNNTNNFNSSRIQDDVRSAIRSNLDGDLPFLDEVADHIIEANPWLERSLLLITTGLLLGAKEEELVHTAASIEYLHAASVLHENIVEIEEFRRTGQEMSGIWGNETSVLLGDYLLSVAFKKLTALGSLEVLESVSRATKKIAKGQVLEISPMQKSVSEGMNTESADGIKGRHKERYFEVMSNRRASLFGAAARSGGIWGEASAKDIDALRLFGFHWGAALALKKEWPMQSSPEDVMGKWNCGQLTFIMCHFRDQIEISAEQDEADSSNGQDFTQFLEEFQKIEWDLNITKFMLDGARQNDMSMMLEFAFNQQLDFARQAMENCDSSALNLGLTSLCGLTPLKTND